MAKLPVSKQQSTRFGPGKRRLSAVQFEALLPFLPRYDVNRMKAARLTLAEGLTLSSVAKLYGWTSRQNVSGAVNNVFAALARFEEVQRLPQQERLSSPQGWEVATLLAPPDLITRWRKELAVECGKSLQELIGPTVATSLEESK